MADFGLVEHIEEEGKLIISSPSFDFDSYPALGERLISTLSATIVEKQTDADIHSWLIDFEGCMLMLKAEHYSESIWLEALSPSEDKDVLAFLSQLLHAGI